MSTIVALNAHPDDESLLSGATLARLADAGHRVVLVVATAGERGLAGGPCDENTLGQRRSAELRAAAQVLGCARVVELGYGDSGSNGGATAPPAAFTTIPVADSAARVAEVLLAERADLLLSYDRNGGYGHPDHLQVHAVGVQAAKLAGHCRVLEATVDRTLIYRAVRLLHRLRLLPAGTDVAAAAHWYSDRGEITHRVRAGRFARQKRAALRCHASQRSGGSGPRTLALLVRLPLPLFTLVAGVEWFVERDAPATRPPLGDVLLAAARLPDPARRASGVAS